MAFSWDDIHFKLNQYLNYFKKKNQSKELIEITQTFLKAHHFRMEEEALLAKARSVTLQAERLQEKAKAIMLRANKEAVASAFKFMESGKKFDPELPELVEAKLRRAEVEAKAAELNANAEAIILESKPKVEAFISKAQEFAKQKEELENPAMAKLKELTESSAAGTAAASDFDAFFLLGYCCKFGLGIQKDLGGSFALYQYAANGGSALAQNILGHYYRVGHIVEKNLPRAIEYFQTAATQGFDLAQENLAGHLMHGMGIKQDTKQALEFYRLAALQNNPEAIYILGLLNDNPREKFQYFCESASKHHHQAQAELGERYLLGVGGVKLNETRAHLLLSASYWNGDRYRKPFNLLLHVRKTPMLIEELKDEVAKYKSAKQDPQMLSNLGFCYQFALGTAADIKQAMEYYQEAIQNGQNDCILDLWSCHRSLLNKSTKPNDRKEAKEGKEFKEVKEMTEDTRIIEFYQKLANENKVEACQVLGEYYSLEVYGHKDPVKALEYFHKVKELRSVNSTAQAMNRTPNEGLLFSAMFVPQRTAGSSVQSEATPEVPASTNSTGDNQEQLYREDEFVVEPSAVRRRMARADAPVYTTNVIPGCRVQ